MARKTSTFKEFQSVASRTNQLCIGGDDPLPVKSSLRSTTQTLRKIGNGSVLDKRRNTLIDKDMTVKQLPKSVQEELTSRDIDDLTNIFEIFAMHSSGRLCFVDLKKALLFLNLHPDGTMLKKIIHANNCGSTYMDSFDLNAYLICVVECQNNSRDVNKEISSGFEKFDIENKERLNIENLTYLNRKYNVGLSTEELKEMLYEADSNGDKQIDRQEFLNIMLKTNLFQ